MMPLNIANQKSDLIGSVWWFLFLCATRWASSEHPSGWGRWQYERLCRRWSCHKITEARARGRTILVLQGTRVWKQSKRYRRPASHLILKGKCWTNLGSNSGLGSFWRWINKRNWLIRELWKKYNLQSDNCFSSHFQLWGAPTVFELSAPHSSNREELE